MRTTERKTREQLIGYTWNRNDNDICVFACFVLPAEMKHLEQEHTIVTNLRSFHSVQQCRSLFRQATIVSFETTNHHHRRFIGRLIALSL